MWLGKLTALDMTPLGWLGRKASIQTNKQKLSRQIFYPIVCFFLKNILILYNAKEVPPNDNMSICIYKLSRKNGKWDFWFQPPEPQVDFLLTTPRRFQCCSSSLCERLLVHMWRWFCSYLFQISPSFVAFGGLCFVIVAFLRYLHL